MDKIEEIEALLPHRRPIVMLAEAFPESAPGIAEARIDVSEECVFFDPSIGGVPSCAVLEYMAQTMAIAVGRERRRNGKDPAVGFVLGTRMMDVFIDMFKPGTDYVARAECTYEDGEFASFDCSIRDSCGTTVAKAALTAFQPGDEKMLEEMS